MSDTCHACHRNAGNLGVSDMRGFITSLFLIASVTCTAQGPFSDGATTSLAASVRTEFRVKYVNGTEVYLDGGRNFGLAEGKSMVLKQAPSKKDTAGQEKSLDSGVLARLTVIAVNSSSALCQVDSSTRDLAVGDFVTLPQPEVGKLVVKDALGNTRKYPMTISFSKGDPLHEEMRHAISHPPLPMINSVPRAQRIGLQHHAGIRRQQLQLSDVRHGGTR